MPNVFLRYNNFPGFVCLSDVFLVLPASYLDKSAPEHTWYQGCMQLGCG